MTRTFEVRWEGRLQGTPEQVWDAITSRTAGWLWPVSYEPWVGGAESGVTQRGGTVTEWEPPRRFVTEGPHAGGSPNRLQYDLDVSGDGTYLRYVHDGGFDDDGDYERQLDMCRRHTAFYQHSLCEYVRHFAGQDATYVTVDGPEGSADGGFAAVLGALGLGDQAAVGDRVHAAIPGAGTIDGVVDYASEAFLGVRTGDALLRVFGRGVWGYPVALSAHLFDPAAAGPAATAAWAQWLDGVLATEAVA